MTSKQLSGSRFTVSPEASASIHDDGIVILHLRSGCLYSSNETGASIWRRLERQLPFETITSEISHEYQLAHSTAGEQVAHFLAQLQQHALIQEQGAL